MSSIPFPLKTFVLNPKAWANPPQGTFSTGSAYYNDYRYQRRPSESASLSRVFRIGEGGKEFSVRVEFTNVFNRRPTTNPTSNNAGAAQTVDQITGKTIAGFGRLGPDIIVNTTGGNTSSRSGTMVARFRF